MLHFPIHPLFSNLSHIFLCNFQSIQFNLNSNTKSFHPHKFQLVAFHLLQNVLLLNRIHCNKFHFQVPFNCNCEARIYWAEKRGEKNDLMEAMRCWRVIGGIFNWILINESKFMEIKAALKGFDETWRGLIIL